MPGIARVHPGRAMPRDERQWNKFFDQLQVDYYQFGQTDYDTGVGGFFGFHQGVPKLSLGDSAGQKVTYANGVLTIVGTITATAGAIGGWTLSATALTSGSGATTVGLDSGGTNPAIYAGSATPASAPFRVTQAGALTATSATIGGALTATSLNLDNIQTFDPTWSGFTTEPSGTLSYADIGNFAIVFSNDARTNTSNATTMSLTGVPAAIRAPSAAGVTVPCFLIDNGSSAWGMVNIDNSGGMQFFIFNGTAPLPFTDTGFTNSAAKGLPAGFFVMYPI